MKKNTKNLVLGALIAALYVALTYMSNIFGLAYGPVQFRFSEALTVLPVFTPAAIPGLIVGCFLSNIASFNPVDMVFGTVATLCAALITYFLKNTRIFSLPLPAMLLTVLINAAVVGAEIAVFTYPAGLIKAFFLSALWVALGEAVTVIGLGSLLFTAINRSKKALNFINTDT